MSKRHEIPFIDLSKPSRKALVFLLRHPELWPASFPRERWDYMNQCGCALGLARAQWGLSICDYRRTAKVLNIAPVTAVKAFFNAAHLSREVTPDMVADLLDMD